MRKNDLKVLFGELLGTFTLVFIGLFSVYGAVIQEWFGLYVVASLWVSGVFLGIVFSRKWSPAHLNPAVTFGFWFSGEKRTFINRALILFGQFAGAFLAAIVLFVIFQNEIESFEVANQINRASEISKSAMIFGEFYPNPAEVDKEVSTPLAFLLEFLGTSVLMLVIFIVSKKVKSKFLTPLLIALTVGVLIVLIAPYTQAGFNPARDLLPRIASYLLGWKSVWYQPGFYPVLVYVGAPVFGASLIGIGNKLVAKK